jgi:hypothetical protein
MTRPFERTEPEKELRKYVFRLVALSRARGRAGSLAVQVDRRDDVPWICEGRSV